ncbi:MFS transporter [Brevibacillus marinus]|uniref:MFS transporter n=1 Tax=Brevibacillus marinus TaxID=2496837 RepID=UPI001F49E20D|nr:MFS transporter [Brevibacillus marinus]
MKVTLARILLIAIGFHTMLWMTRPIVTLYASELGAGTMEIGLLTSIYAFLPLLLAVRAGRFADHVGDRTPLLLGMVGCVAGMLVPSLFPARLSLYLSQIMVGISQVIVNISLQNALGNAANDANRDHYFGVFSMMVALAGCIGPIAGGYVSEHYSYSAVYLVGGLLCAGPIILSWGIPAKRKPRTEADSSLSNSLQLLQMPLLRKALLSSALVLYSREIFVAYFPLYGQKLQLSDSLIGWIIALQGLAMVPIRFYLSRMVGAFGRDRVLLWSILLAGVSFLLVPFLDQVYLLMLLSALMGIGLGCGQPLSMTTIYNVSPRNRTGEVLGLRLATNRLSQLIAPLFFGMLGNWLGLVSVFYVSGAFLIGGAFLTKPKSSDESVTLQV